MKTETTPVLPGPQELIAGDLTTGFYGEVGPDDFISYGALSILVGLSAGFLHNQSQPWLKFSLDGVPAYVMKQPGRNRVSHDDLSELGLVDGSKLITLEGTQYRLRVMSGLDDYGSLSDWSRLFYPIHEDDPNEQEWEINYTDDDLGLECGSWCQETNPNNSADHVSRGFSHVENSYMRPSWFTHGSYGWRAILIPVIEHKPSNGADIGEDKMTDGNSQHDPKEALVDLFGLEEFRGILTTAGHTGLHSHPSYVYLMTSTEYDVTASLHALVLHRRAITSGGTLDRSYYQNACFVGEQMAMQDESIARKYLEVIHEETKWLSNTPLSSPSQYPYIPPSIPSSHQRGFHSGPGYPLGPYAGTISPPQQRPASDTPMDQEWEYYNCGVGNLPTPHFPVFELSQKGWERMALDQRMEWLRDNKGVCLGVFNLDVLDRFGVPTHRRLVSDTVDTTTTSRKYQEAACQYGLYVPGSSDAWVLFQQLLERLVERHIEHLSGLDQPSAELDYFTSILLSIEYVCSEEKLDGWLEHYSKILSGLSEKPEWLTALLKQVN